MDHSKYTMIGVDPEGYGKSRPPDRNPFIDEFCLERDARLAGEVMNVRHPPFFLNSWQNCGRYLTRLTTSFFCILKTLGYDRYSIVGWSNGGISASILAQMRPQNIISISLCNAPLKLADRNNLVMDREFSLHPTPPWQLGATKSFWFSCRNHQFEELGRETPQGTFPRL